MARNSVVEALLAQIIRLQLAYDADAASLASVEAQRSRLQASMDEQARTIAELTAAVEQMGGTVPAPGTGGTPLGEEAA